MTRAWAALLLLCAMRAKTGKKGGREGRREGETYLGELLDSLCFIPYPLSAQWCEFCKATDEILGVLDEDRVFLRPQALVVEAEAGRARGKNSE